MKRHSHTLACLTISIPVFSDGGFLLLKNAAKKPPHGIAIHMDEAFAAAGPIADPVPEKTSPVQFIEKNNSCIVAIPGLLGIWFLFTLQQRGRGLRFERINNGGYGGIP
jgi:hypothetical protein